MIEHLNGTILERRPDRCLLDVSGVGFALGITPRTFQALPEAGGRVALHVRMLVREDAITLFGFATALERDMFDMLMEAKGVGPRVALSAVGALGPDRLAIAIVEKDVKLLGQIPGVGKKTAEQLSLDLMKKMAPYAQAAQARQSIGGTRTSAAAEASLPGDETVSPSVREAMAALGALGCPPLVAQRAAAKAAEILGADASVEALVREGLKHRKG